MFSRNAPQRRSNGTRTYASNLGILAAVMVTAFLGYSYLLQRTQVKAGPNGAPEASAYQSDRRAAQQKHADLMKAMLVEIRAPKPPDPWRIYAEAVMQNLKSRIEFLRQGTYPSMATLSEPKNSDEAPLLLPPPVPKRERCPDCPGGNPVDYHSVWMSHKHMQQKTTCVFKEPQPPTYEQYLQLRKKGKKVLVFGLYGNNPRYVHGVYRNLELLGQMYPFWGLRIYYDESSVPSQDVDRFRRLGIELIKMREAQRGGIEGMFWRFMVADDSTVDRYIVRDSDSRISKREALAVDDWILSGKKFHSVRDHPSHSNYRLNGGLWGGTKDSNIQIMQKIAAVAKSSYGHDLDFLTSIYSSVENDLIAHDSYSCSACGNVPGECASGITHQHSVKYPTVRAGKEHIGARFTHEDIPFSDGDVGLMLQFTVPVHCSPCYAYPDAKQIPYEKNVHYRSRSTS